MGRERTDVIVIGAGVIGLATARALALAGRDVLVLERHAGIGQETSSRNSEVIHAGLYYPPNSLKARSCVRGKYLLYRYCDRKGVAFRKTGKLIVATHDGQLKDLEALERNAVASGVDDVEWIDKDGLRLLEPALRAEAALLSPSTGIVDTHALMLALLADLEEAGGTLACGSTVRAGRVAHQGIELRIQNASDLSLLATTVINAGGLTAAQLARGIDGLPPESIPGVHFVRGHYYAYGNRSPFRRLVYPMPDPDGLGVHGTLDLAGQLRFGPDAEYKNRIDYSFDDDRRQRFANSIERWFPALDRRRLQPGYVGIRPRLAGPGEGFRDFVISGPNDHGVAGLINLFGIESPGLTACLALAEEITECCQDERGGVGKQ